MKTAMSEVMAQLEALDARSEKTWTKTVGDARMCWRRWGDGPALVLLHGGAGNWMHWIRNIPNLARSHTVWVPDMPGFGDSDLPGEGLDADTIAPMVLDGALQVLRGQPFHLVGFSFGALVASYLAALNPPSLRGLLLVGAAGMGLLGDMSSLRSMRGIKDPEEREEILRHNLALIMLSREEAIDELAVAVQGYAGSRERVRGRTLALRDVLAPVAAQWACPAYGIWGEEDFNYIGRIDQLRSRISQLGLRRFSLLPNTGHWLQYQNAEGFHKSLRDFLQDTSS